MSVCAARERLASSPPKAVLSAAVTVRRVFPGGRY